MRTLKRFWVMLIVGMGLLGYLGWLTQVGQALPAPAVSAQQQPLSPSQKVEQVLRLCQNKQYELAKPIALSLIQSPDEYEQLVKEDRITLHRCLALIYSAEGRVDLADEQLRQVQALRQATIVPRMPQPPPPPSPPLPPPTPAEKLAHLVTLCRQKLYTEAEQAALAISETDYQQLSEIEKIIFHHCWVQIRSAQGQMADAEAHLQQVRQLRQAMAVSAAPPSLSDRVREVLALTEMANFPEAKLLAEAALQDEAYATLSPREKIILHRCLAQIYAAEGDDQRATEQFRQILAIDPRFALKDPSSPLSDVVSPRIEKAFSAARPRPSSAVLALVGLGVAAIIGELRSGATPGEPDPNQFSLSVSPNIINAPRESDAKKPENPNGIPPQSATIILQVRDSFGRIVTRESSIMVDLSINNQGANYKITLAEPEKGTQVSKTDGEVSEVKATYRVQAGEVKVTMTILAKDSVPRGTAQDFSVTALFRKDNENLVIKRSDFRILVPSPSSPSRTPLPTRLLITGLTAQATRGGQVVASFSLNRAAQVRATLRTMSGQTVQMMPARAATRGLNTLIVTGEQLRHAPPGTYLLEIEALADDGAFTRASMPLVITR